MHNHFFKYFKFQCILRATEVLAYYFKATLMTFEPAADFLTLKTVKIIKIYPKLLYDDSS